MMLMFITKNNKRNYPITIYIDKQVLHSYMQWHDTIKTTVVLCKKIIKLWRNITKYNDFHGIISNTSETVEHYGFHGKNDL